MNLLDGFALLDGIHMNGDRIIKIQIAEQRKQIVFHLRGNIPQVQHLAIILAKLVAVIVHSAGVIMLRLPVVTTGRNKILCRKGIFCQQPIIRKFHNLFRAGNTMQQVQALDTGEPAYSAAHALEKVLNVLGAFEESNLRFSVIVLMQANGDVLFPNQSILSLQCLFRYNAVHFLAVPITLVTTQRQERVAAELCFIHTPGYKTDLQMRVRIEIVQEFTVLGKKTFLFFLPRQLKIDIRERHCHGEKPRLHLTDAAFVHTLVLQTVRSFLRCTALLDAAGALCGVLFGLLFGFAQLLRALLFFLCALLFHLGGSRFHIRHFCEFFSFEHFDSPYKGGSAPLHFRCAMPSKFSRAFRTDNHHDG